jgi:hypothetical protein
MGRRFFLFIAICLLWGAFYASPALAQCIDGLPCVVDKTANDPAVDGDGPNAAGSPNTKKSTSKACDADFMNQIYARAFLESEREVVLAGVAIRKPDSVLEYTCFDKLALDLAEKNNMIFANKSTSANSFLPNSVSQYLSGSFSHKFLGRDGGSDPDYTAGGGGGGYSCDMMDSVNLLARCMDFDQDGHQFYSFETLATLDPRTLPGIYKCTATDVKDDLIKLSQNADMKHVSFDVWGDFKKLAYETTCEDPIDTGLIAKYRKFVRIAGIGDVTTSNEEFPHQVCVNPICYYDPDANKCVAK